MPPRRGRGQPRSEEGEEEPAGCCDVAQHAWIDVFTSVAKANKLAFTSHHALLDARNAVRTVDPKAPVPEENVNELRRNGSLAARMLLERGGLSKKMLDH